MQNLLFPCMKNHHPRLRIITPINAAEICFMVDHNNLFTNDFQKVVKRLYYGKKLIKLNMDAEKYCK